MSSILKALKKLEEENAARRHDPVRIDAEILRAPSAPRVSPIGITLAAALLFICGGTVTYLFMAGNRHAPPPAQRERVSPTAAAVTPRARTGTESLAALPQTRRMEQYPAPPPDRAPPSRPRPTPTKPGQQASRAGGERAKPDRRPVLAQQGTGQHAHAAPSVPVPTLRVDGIAFQDGADGVAVVNGVPVSRGSSVEGVRVDEVQRDRVLFSHGGKKIVVLMGTSNR